MIGLSIPILCHHYIRRLRRRMAAVARPTAGVARKAAGLAWVVLAISCTFCIVPYSHGWNPATTDALSRMIGDGDAVAVADNRNRFLYSKNIDKLKVPASTLKLLTGLAAIDTLGPNFRFTTEFYTGSDQSLSVKGYGDPLLISEVLSDIAAELANRLEDPIANLVIDDSYFQEPLLIPGVTDSLNPYDAPNGALCVNFNTVYYRQKDGVYISAEPQTPLLPIVMDRIRRTGLEHGRIVLSRSKQELLLYAGHLFAYFLADNGKPVTGDIRPGRMDPTGNRLVLRHLSPYTLFQVIERMLEYSNNYVANQLLIAAGAHAYGPPGTLEKGVRCLNDYLVRVLGIEGSILVEGSGISRKNRLTARSMLNILDRFEPHRHLLRRDGPVLFKTGTLQGISTRAGYIEGGGDEVYRFVVLLNSDRRSVDRIVSIIQKGLVE